MTLMLNLSIKQLTQIYPDSGELVWLGIRPAKFSPMQTVSSVFADHQSGLVGDHYSGKSGKRHITLIQWEHLAVLSSLTGQPVSPDLVRRNFAVKGINLLALKQQKIKIGGAILFVTGLCHPCSRMETQLGRGGYNAMRGHGGITAQIIQSGLITLGDKVSFVSD